MEPLREISLDSYIGSVRESITRCFAPWSKMSPLEWAEEVYRLPGGGRFKWNYAPYAKRMFTSMFDRQTIETSYMIYSRGLKSTVMLLAMGYLIDQAPRRILCMWPTLGQAEKFSKDALVGELFNTTPCLNFLGDEKGRRNASNTILHKAFPGGVLTLFGANSPGDVRRAKGSFLSGDEIDAIEGNIGDEGDILMIFDKRGGEYKDTIRVKASYPSVKGVSRIQKKVEASDYNEWWVTCVECGGEPFVMHRSMLRYDKGKTHLTKMECPRCAALLDDNQRYSMAHSQGFDNWRPRHDFKGFRGFHANAMLWPHPFDEIKMPGGALQMIAMEEEIAKASADPRKAIKVVVNTVDAEPFDPTEESELPPDWRPVFDRREDYGEVVPMGGLFMTAFCDVQLNRLEVGWRAWGRDDESWGMDYVVLDGNVRDSEVWGKLKHELSRKFKHESGASLSLGMALVDGGRYAEDVYRFMSDIANKPVPGVTGKCRASKGFGQHGHPVIDRKWKSVARSLKGYHIGTWEAKDRIYQTIKAGDSITGYMHYNKRFPAEYFQMLTVEKVLIVFEKGVEVRKYINPDNARNEALDIEVGCLAAFKLHPKNLDAIESQIMEDAAARKVSAAAPVERVRKTFGGWD